MNKEIILSIICIIFVSLLYSMIGCFIDYLYHEGEFKNNSMLIIMFWPMALIVFLLFWLIKLPMKIADIILERRNKK